MSSVKTSYVVCEVSQQLSLMCFTKNHWINLDLNQDYEYVMQMQQQNDMQTKW